MAERHRPPFPRHDEAGLEERQVEAGTVEGDDAAGACQYRLQAREQRRFLVEVTHEVLSHDEALVLEPPGADEKGVRARSTGQARGLRIQEEEPAQVVGGVAIARDDVNEMSRSAAGLTESQAPVPMLEWILVANDEQATGFRLDDMATDDRFHRLRCRPSGPHALDASDDAAKLVQRPGADVSG